MTDFDFAVESVRVEPYAASPTLVFRLRLTETSGARVHTGLLRCQLQIDARGRRYSPAEGERLVELFDRPERWVDTVRPILWAQIAVVVPQFEHQIEIDVPVACTYDVEVASAKYFHALEDGEAPIAFLFSGTVFVAAGEGFHAVPVAWDKESRFRLPVQTWRALMTQYFGDSAWIRLRRDSFETLCRFRARNALPSWEATVDALCASAAPAGAADREPV